MRRTRRAAVRAAVLWTNGVWPFSRLNRVAYRLALAAFVRTCRAEPDIASVYLRRGFAGDDWVPGLSDIDFTVILDERPTGAAEGDLRRFWARYDRIKRLFPMLGDVDLFGAEEIDACRLTARGREAGDWKLVAGRDTIDRPKPRSADEEAIDGLNRGLLYYLTFFLNRFYEPVRPSAIRFAEMQRLGHRLVRDAHGGRPDVADPCAAAGRDAASLLRGVLVGLDSAVAGLRHVTADAATPRTEVVGAFERILEGDAIDSVLAAYQTRVIVVKPDVDPAQLIRCLERIRGTFTGDAQPPVVVTARLLDYMVRFYDPFLYTHLRQYAEIVYGRDVVSPIAPPTDSAFANWLLDQVPTLILFSRSRSLLSGTDAAWYAGREVESAFERSLFVRMYLETGRIIPCHARLLASCRERYGASYERWRRVEDAARRGDVVMARQEAFGLLRTELGSLLQALAPAGTTAGSGTAARVLFPVG